MTADWDPGYLTPHELGWWRTRLDLNRNGHVPFDIPNQTGIWQIELNPALAPPTNYFPEPSAYQVRIALNDGTPSLGYQLKARKRTIAGGNLSYFTDDRVFREGVLVTYVNDGLEQDALGATVIENPQFPDDSRNPALSRTTIIVPCMTATVVSPPAACA